METADVRKTAILRLCHGIVFLRSRGMPSAPCSLHLLTETECACTLALDGSESILAESWTAYLQPGRRLAIDISAPPHLPGLHLEAEVRHADRNADRQMDLGLGFVEVDAEQSEILKKAQQSLGGSKSNGPGTSSKRLSAFTHPRPVLPASPITPPSGTDLRGLLDGVLSGSSEAGSSAAAPAAETRGIAAAPDAAGGVDAYRGKMLGAILVQLGKLTPDQVEDAQRGTKSIGEMLGRYLLRTGQLTPLDLCGALSLQSGLPVVDLSPIPEIPPDLANLFSYLHLLKHECIPFAMTADSVCIAALHPLGATVLAEMRQRCGKNVKVFLAEDDLILKLLRGLQPSKDRKLRKHSRYELNVPIAFRFFNQQQGMLGEDILYGKTLDIGDAGLSFCTAEDLRERGACVQISFSFAPSHVEALCSVRYVKESPREGFTAEMPWKVGLQFMDATQEARENLTEICNRLRMWRQRDRRKPFDKT